MVSRQLCPYVKSVVGVDISELAVERYNARASEQRLVPEEMRAVCAELRGEPGELGGTRFDLILVRPSQCPRYLETWSSRRYPHSLPLLCITPPRLLSPLQVFRPPPVTDVVTLAACCPSAFSDPRLSTGPGRSDIMDILCTSSRPFSIP